MAPCTGGICLWHSVHLMPGTNDLRAAADMCRDYADGFDALGVSRDRWRTFESKQATYRVT